MKQNKELTAHFAMIDPRFSVLELGEGKYNLTSTGRTFVTLDAYDYTLAEMRVLYTKCKSGLVFVAKCGTDR